MPTGGAASGANRADTAVFAGEVSPKDAAPTDTGAPGNQVDAVADSGTDAATVSEVASFDDATPPPDAVPPADAVISADAVPDLVADATPDTAADTGLDATADAAAEIAVAKGKVAVLLSTSLVEMAQFGKTLTVTCQALAADGTAAPDPGDFSVTFEGAFGIGKAGGWTFAKPGKGNAVCASAKLGTGSASFVIAQAGLDPGLSRLATDLGKASALVQAVVAGASSPAVQEKALADFHAVGLVMAAGLGAETKVLLPLPKGLPSADKLLAKGVVAGADDAAFATALATLKAALVATRTTLATIDPKKANDVDKVKLAAELSKLASAQQVLAALKPSALGVLAALPELNLVLGVELPKTAQKHHLWVSKVLHAQPGAPAMPPCPNCFSLVEIGASLAAQYALDSVPSYTSILKDLGWVVGEMVVTMTIKEVIDTQFPPSSGGPSIDAIQALGQAAVPGLPLKILASNFGGKPGDCSVIFITPLVAKTIVDAVKLAVGGIPSLKDLKTKSAWEAAKVVKEAIDQVKATAELVGGVPELAATGVVTMTAQPGSTFDSEIGFINLGVVPNKINCGIVPKPRILYPYCTFTGSGTSFELLVIQEKCL